MVIFLNLDAHNVESKDTDIEIKKEHEILNFKLEDVSDDSKQLSLFESESDCKPKASATATHGHDFDYLQNKVHVYTKEFPNAMNSKHYINETNNKPNNKNNTSVKKYCLTQSVKFVENVANQTSLQNIPSQTVAVHNTIQQLKGGNRTPQKSVSIKSRIYKCKYCSRDFSQIFPYNKNIKSHSDHSNRQLHSDNLNIQLHQCKL